MAAANVVLSRSVVPAVRAVERRGGRGREREGEISLVL
jgi:hypothetical protein